MRGLLQQTKLSNKRAISEMVSYVLLVVIAVGLSVAVYAYLKVFVPNDLKPECKDDVQLIVQSSNCTINPTKAVSVTLYNKGLFRVNAVLLRLGAEERKVRLNLKEIPFSGDGLLPGNSTSFIISSQTILGPILIAPGKYTLEIQPEAINERGELAVCEKSVITQPLTCA